MQFAHSPDATGTASSSVTGGRVFGIADIDTSPIAAGVSLRELVGRTSAGAKTAAMSVAQFTIHRGTMLETGFNREAQEVLLVTRGTGNVVLDQTRRRLVAGSVVFIPAGLAHTVAADGKGALEFLAICAPAFDAQDHVIVK